MSSNKAKIKLLRGGEITLRGFTKSTLHGINRKKGKRFLKIVAQDARGLLR